MMLIGVCCETPCEEISDTDTAYGLLFIDRLSVFTYELDREK